jgi:hypothetical protein
LNYHNELKIGNKDILILNNFIKEEYTEANVYDLERILTDLYLQFLRTYKNIINEEDAKKIASNFITLQMIHFSNYLYDSGEVQKSKKLFMVLLNRNLSILTIPIARNYILKVYTK